MDGTPGGGGPGNETADGSRSIRRNAANSLRFGTRGRGSGESPKWVGKPPANAEDGSRAPQSLTARGPESGGGLRLCLVRPWYGHCMGWSLTERCQGASRFHNELSNQATEMDRQRHALLLVEDHDTTRRVLARLLSLNGWEVQTASTIAEGLALLDSGPDCVIVDLMLPDGEGEMVLRRVRDGRLRTRVVVTTATADEARLERVRRLGADAILRKPIDVDEVCRLCESPTP